MTVRDELRALAAQAFGVAEDDECAGFAADYFLDWLGNLDPDADPELIVWHLKTNRDRIRELEADNLALLDLLGDTDD